LVGSSRHRPRRSGKSQYAAINSRKKSRPRHRIEWDQNYAGTPFDSIDEETAALRPDLQITIWSDRKNLYKRKAHRLRAVIIARVKKLCDLYDIDMSVKVELILDEEFVIGIELDPDGQTTDLLAACLDHTHRELIAAYS